MFDGLHKSLSRCVYIDKLSVPIFRANQLDELKKQVSVLMDQQRLLNAALDAETLQAQEL